MKLINLTTVPFLLIAGTLNAAGWWPSNQQNSGVKDNAVQPQRVIDAFNANPELSGIVEKFKQDPHHLVKAWDMSKFYDQMLKTYPRSPGQVRKIVPIQNQNFNLTMMRMLKAIDGQPNRGMTIPQITQMFSYQMIYNSDFESNIYTICNNLYKDNPQVVDQVFALESINPLEKSAQNYWEEVKADAMSGNKLNTVFVNLRENSRPFYDSIMRNVRKRELKRRLWLL
ncbi:hypothetical protein CONCODRAFT_11961 [Conidiobolus coronatus NRRL 28638]|uniref:Uncharacterized protein n=1 Tax=Conidiobolus coronatus (strain ATCC 28846 / CBS 209.66 / NRRL 28638) TaxID=796925 RepID=A0A137NTY3_CONC2|nr:hypothetical protein CONCODRAFT_11961 [Conidiobolus coronatus NRRL 28638]|eukprot:KXN66237.1 hypothetical protein CONCODRAFT_11961 [Conidiobolus coronatus NRRL 28638]